MICSYSLERYVFYKMLKMHFSNKYVIGEYKLKSCEQNSI